MLLLSLFVLNLAMANSEYPNEGNLLNDTYSQDIDGGITGDPEVLDSEPINERAVTLPANLEPTNNDEQPAQDFEREPIAEPEPKYEENVPYENEDNLDNYNKDRVEDDPYKDDYPVEKYEDPYKEEPYKDDYNSDAYPAENVNDDYNNENY